jgi:hypothetical protein
MCTVTAFHTNDAIEVHARCMSLFAYARNEEDYPLNRIGKGNLVHSATLLIQFPSQDPLMLKILDRTD